ncbi:hypothetical protein CPB83DRAFT_862361 [Crepidotus variabilis]|uniref:Uncharacterized protein n=1 Tax=Crepidotus variabilis TaxID=179855 RepID=A0A9P6E748_9AGAR|nr:hypothetical protein CPB83DRAFT_862361 [Crepidotus variabilis]
MSDCGAAMAYLCRTCCCLIQREGEVTPDGSHFRSAGKRDPREKLVEDEFMARSYRKDKSGRLHVQPAPTAPMTATRTESGETKGSDASVSGLPIEAPEIQITPPTEKSKSAVEGAQLDSVQEVLPNAKQEEAKEIDSMVPP